MGNIEVSPQTGREKSDRQSRHQHHIITLDLLDLPSKTTVCSCASDLEFEDLRVKVTSAHLWESNGNTEEEMWGIILYVKKAPVQEGVDVVSFGNKTLSHAWQGQFWKALNKMPFQVTWFCSMMISLPWYEERSPCYPDPALKVTGLLKECSKMISVSQ